MIVESSGILALRRREPDANRYETAIASALNCRMSVANLLEVFIVVESRGGAAAGHECDAFFDKAVSSGCRSHRNMPRLRGAPGGALERGTIRQG